MPAFCRESATERINGYISTVHVVVKIVFNTVEFTQVITV